MEELIEPHKQENTDPEEERTDEVQTIIDRMPTRGATYVAGITAVLILVTVLLGFLIKYPDTVDGQISITALYAPVKIVANNNGRLHLLKANNETVKQGEIISWLDNAADYDEIERIAILLKQYRAGASDSVILPENVELGEISSAYSNFLLAHKQYFRFINENSYRTQRSNLQSQIKIDSSILENMNQEILLRDQVMGLITLQNKRDSSMFASKAITEADMIQRKSDYLSKQEAYQTLLTNKSTLVSRIHSNRISLTQLDVEEAEKRESFLSSLLANINELTNSIEIWKQKYAVYAPIDGQLEYLNFWRENTFVQAGEALYSILPAKNEIVGEVIVPSYGIGKVKIGQDVNIKLDNFPYDEYGSINGKVKSISHMSNVTKTANGDINSYLVVVAFPEGSRTNYDRTLDLNFETKGMAEIITKRKKLIHRLFDNLKYRFTE